MDTIDSVKALQQCLNEGRSCKIALRDSDKLRKSIVDANVVEKLDTGIQLIPNDITKVLMATICQIGTIVAKAPFQGYGLGLKRKENELYLYFSKKKTSAES